MAEIELSVLKRQAIKGRAADKMLLIGQVEQWQQKPNLKQAKANWQFRTKDARIKLKKLYPAF